MEQLNDSTDIDIINRFFNIKRTKYIFVLLEDERMLNHLLEAVIDGQERKGKVIHHFLLSDTDFSVYRQIKNFTQQKILDGLMVSGLNELIDKYGDHCVDTLNKSRDAFVNIGLPIVWIITKNTLGRILWGASDFYQMRHLPDFHIQGTSAENKTEFDNHFFYNPYPGDKEIDSDYLEKQLGTLSKDLSYEKDTVNGIVVPLLRKYIDRNDAKRMKRLYNKYLKGHEGKVYDTYIIVSYYTAIGKLAESPIFPRYYSQPVIASPGISSVEHDAAQELLNAIHGKRGAVVLAGTDGPEKSGLISQTLEKLKQDGFDFFTIVGETSPELILLNMALKAQEKGDKNAIKNFTGSDSLEKKLEYYIKYHFSRHKTACFFKYFEENQSEMPGGGCKSQRLKKFLQHCCDLLKNKDSFLFFTTSSPMAAFFTVAALAETTPILTQQRIDGLSPHGRDILEVLSIFHSPVKSEALRFFDIDIAPDDMEPFRILENLSLLDSFLYGNQKKQEERRFYVPPSVSRLVQKKMDGKKIKEYHIIAGEFLEKYRQDEETSYIINTIEARRHFIEAIEWNQAAELTLKLFWPVYTQNFKQWSLELLSELDLDALSRNLQYHIQRRLGLLYYYSGAYAYSWSHYEKALALAQNQEESWRLISEILPIEMAVNQNLMSNNRRVFKGISHSIQVPPLEIIQQGPNAILNYFEDIQKTTIPLLECKLIIVGTGGVGKTSLVKKLKDPSRHLDLGKDETTHDIHIVPWELPCTFENGETHNVKIHFWDFGGQAIYHAAHQFFLAKRSLYLFVWETHKGEEFDSFDYWLNTIKFLSDNSPVMVVMNKSDKRIKAIDEAGLKAKFKNIVHFIQVSCLTGENIRELSEEIAKALGHMPHLLDRIPKTWLDIRDDLKNINQNYISLDEYFQVCRVYNMNEERALFLGEYLHDLGYILHFRNDPVLNDTVILQPEWVTGAAYTLLDGREIIENKGRFKMMDLRRIWNEETYPLEKHPILIRLMEKFELCFNIVGIELYIVPGLLPNQGPDMVLEKYRSAQNLRFRYSYDFMPVGILVRFISRIYYLIKENHFWLNGVELLFEDTAALVMSERLSKRITISISGSNRAELLAIIRSRLDHIHRTWNMENGEHYVEEVPCTCSVCANAEKPYFYNYEALKRLEQKNIPNYCMISGEEVPPAILRKSIEPPKPNKGLFNSLISIADQLRGIARAIQPDEDTRNSLVSLLLSVNGFRVKDQSRWGLSATGKSIAEVDIKVESDSGQTVCVIEAFSLKNFDKRIINNHLLKLFSYDSSALEDNYILVYAEAKDFIGLWKNYLRHLAETGYPFPVIGNPGEENTEYAEIKAARTRHFRHGRETIIHHVFINMFINKK